MKVKLSAGAELDLLTQDEMRQVLSEADQIELARIAAVKWMRLPQTLTGTVASAAINLGADHGQECGPREGYFWSIRRLVVSGLSTTGPDKVNLYRGNGGGEPLWQFNGNNFAYTFGKGQLSLFGGETLALVNVGSLTATGVITLSGELVEAPGPLAGKIVD